MMPPNNWTPCEDDNHEWNDEDQPWRGDVHKPATYEPGWPEQDYLDAEYGLYKRDRDA